MRPPSPAPPAVPLSSPSNPPDGDLLGELASKLVREEKARRAAEKRVSELEAALRDADAQRDKAVTELRGTVDSLHRELKELDRQRNAERAQLELEIDRVRAESAAEIASLRARRSPSVHTMVAIREEAQQEVAVELEAVRRTADEAIAALRELVERKEAAIAEGRAALERLHPNIVQEVLSGERRPSSPGLTRPSMAPTPARGVSVRSDYPEITVEDENG